MLLFNFLPRVFNCLSIFKKYRTWLNKQKTDIKIAGITSFFGSMHANPDGQEKGKEKNQ